MTTAGYLSPHSPLVSIRKLERLLGVERATLFDIASRAGGLYQSFDRRALRGKGKWRHIDNPFPDLKRIQSAILKKVLYSVKWPTPMKGAVPRVSILDNAHVHCNQPVVVTLDFKSCFPNTTHEMVYQALRSNLGCSSQIANLLTKLMTLRRQVPQGAPTSPAVVNLTLLGLCGDLEEIALRHDLKFTIWIDDITISGLLAETAIGEVINAIHRHGHSVSSDKLKVQWRTYRQVVTGVVVNRFPSSAHDRREDIRAQILVLGAKRNPPHREIQSVLGRIANVRQISAAQAESLTRLAEKCLPKQGVGGARGRTDEVVRCDCNPEHCLAVASRRRTGLSL